VIVLLALPVAVVVAVVMSRRRGRRLRKLASPLAGYDTGTRSAWRTPGRFFKPHKGF
jgi:hypothetical protein